MPNERANLLADSPQQSHGNIFETEKDSSDLRGNCEQKRITFQNKSSGRNAQLQIFYSHSRRSITSFKASSTILKSWQSDDKSKDTLAKFKL